MFENGRPASARFPPIADLRACRLLLGHTKLESTTLVDAREIPAAQVAQWRRSWVPPLHDEIDCDRSDYIFPVRMPLEAEGHGRVGWLLFGPRPGGSLFGKSEFIAIEEAAEPVARAIEVTLRRQERERHLENRLRSLERAVGKLTGKVGSRARPVARA